MRGMRRFGEVDGIGSRREALGAMTGWGAMLGLGIMTPWQTSGADPTSGTHPVTRSVDGKPVCGLGREFHEGRRRALLEAIGDGVFVMRGLDEPRDYLRFYQDKNFWYLTGISSPGAALILDGRTGEQLLFLPTHDAFKEQWDGEIWDTDDAWVSELTGFANVLPNLSLEDELAKRLENRPAVHLVMTPHIGLAGGTDMAMPHHQRMEKDPFDGRPTREKRFAQALEERYGVSPSNVSRRLAALRQVKTVEELAAMRRAAVVGSAAIAEGIRSTGAGRGEWEIEAVMSFVHERHGAAGPAYTAICGSGPNNNVLHYFHANRRMNDGELLLVDYGPDVDCYTTDITRTWPVSGRFSDRQREVYDIVLEAQAAGIEAAKPGNSQGDIASAIQRVFTARGMTSFVKHSPLHSIGLEVHDVGGRGPFIPGMCFAIEPGLYLDDEGFGIRIEDVVVITEQGCEVITREGLPVEAEALEAMVAESGLLDR